MKHCPHCGELFTPVKRSQIYCNVTCRLRAQNVRHREDYARWARGYRQRERQKSLQLKSNQLEELDKHDVKM